MGNEGAEIEYSLEDLVCLLKNPPLFERILLEKNFLTKEDKKKFSSIKEVYNSSLWKVINSEREKLPIKFRSFLRRFDSYFGDGYSILGSLDSESIEYVVGSLQFYENLQKHRNSIPMYGSNLNH